MRAYHPILGRRVPEVDDIVRRCDRDACHVMKGAILFAQRRVEIAEKIRDLDEELFEAPHIGGRPGLYALPDQPSLMRTDLVRALCMDAPLAVCQVLTAGSREYLGSIRRQVSRRDTPITELDPEWARRWVLADLMHNSPAVDSNYLLASLWDTVGLECCQSLAAFDHAYQSGSESQSNAAAYICERGSHLLKCFENVPPAYLDRGQKLSALISGLRSKRGAFIAGPPGSSRTALLWAFRAKVFYDRPSAAEFGRVYVGSAMFFRRPDNEEMEEWQAILSRPPAVLGLSPEGIGQGGYLSDVSRVLEHFTAMEVGEGSHVVAVVTPEELRLIHEQIPATRSFAAIHLAPLEDLDRIPVQLCNQFPSGRVSLIRAAMEILELQEAPRWLKKFVESGEIPSHWMPQWPELIERWIGDAGQLQRLRNLEARLNEGLPVLA
jgi:hypothetical protein